MAPGQWIHHVETKDYEAISVVQVKLRVMSYFWLRQELSKSLCLSVTVIEHSMLHLSLALRSLLGLSQLIHHHILHLIIIINYMYVIRE